MVVVAPRRAARWQLLPQPQMCHAHLVGVAGAGLRRVAEVLLAAGWRVSGSDCGNSSLGALVARGLALAHGHHESHLPNDAHLVVYSPAVAVDNAELRRAHSLNVPVLSYPQWLGALSHERPTLAIAGTHGKSTTTAMVEAIFARAGITCDAFYGAESLDRPPGLDDVGQGRLLVEACEYQRNFLQLHPQGLAILGVEHDHVDCYPRPADVEQAFASLAERVPADGLVLTAADCSRAMDAAATTPGRLVSFGLQPWADWWAGDLRAESGCYAFRLFHRGRHASTIALRVPGRHNVRNAVAAAALAAEHGATMRVVREALADFAGLRRRLESYPAWRGVARIDDYAHHPNEVAAVLAAVRQMHPGRRVVCVFQPHQYLRLTRLLDEFARSLHNADTAWIAPVYRARETVAEDLCRAATTALAHQVWARGGDACAASQAEIVADLRRRLAPGDVLVTLGAGDIENVQHELGR